MAAELLVPESPEQAASLYGDGVGVTVFGGGTILMPALAAGRLRAPRALLLHRSGLATLRDDGATLRIGAMLPLAALVEGPEPLLARSAGQIGDRELRASATVGGNLCAPAGDDAQRGDLGAALIALGARVRSSGAGGEQTEPVEDFLARDRSRRLVLELELERVERSWAFESLHRRHAHSFAVATVAVCASQAHGLRVGVAGVGATAVRCRAVETSGDPGEVLKDVEALDDAVASRSYREQMLPILLARALAQVKPT